jgi:Carboxypeptidase regulatory-like domain
MCAMRLKSLVPKIAVLVSLLVVGTLDFGQDNTSVLIGTVTDQSLAPAAGVLVTLSSMDRVYQTKSSTDGGFRFVAVPTGTYDVEFAAEGFVRQKVSVDLSHEAAQSLGIVLNFSSQPDTNYCGPMLPLPAPPLRLGILWSMPKVNL